nr:hypothetical protein [Tanacetum cinerariifolium]GEY56645.1 hypothetical protein [Tanacetum cinerariifolium]
MVMLNSVVQTQVIHLSRDIGSPKLPSSGMELNLLDMEAMDLHQPKSLLTLLLDKPTMLKPLAYSTAGYAQPLYDAQQPPAYEGSYGGGYQPRAYSSDATTAAPTS